MESLFHDAFGEAGLIILVELIDEPHQQNDANNDGNQDNHQNIDNQGNNQQEENPGNVENNSDTESNDTDGDHSETAENNRNSSSVSDLNGIIGCHIDIFNDGIVENSGEGEKTPCLKCLRGGQETRKNQSLRRGTVGGRTSPTAAVTVTVLTTKLLTSILEKVLSNIKVQVQILEKKNRSQVLSGNDQGEVLENKMRAAKSPDGVQRTP
ncbi:Hypothetical predicted protein [Xyrichtys novacula]|uniref:Uncharacterized protein n=1 Tax=Xyrichtys novacula TaxID=13765 RepID=A0AAV1H874_XYRNO|nr:Hypothetical predicted protein [Xyrichtys novacula]